VGRLLGVWEKKEIQGEKECEPPPPPPPPENRGDGQKAEKAPSREVVSPPRFTTGICLDQSSKAISL